MSKKIKIGAFLLAGALATWVGITLYTYVFDQSKPVLTIAGIEDNTTYAGDVSCTIRGYDEYKVGYLWTYLDNELLVEKHPIGKQEFDYTFRIATQGLSDGQHELQVVAEDSSRAKNTSSYKRTFFVDNKPLRVAFVKNDTVYKVFQGQTLHVQFQTNKPLASAEAHLFSTSYPCTQENKNSHVYECFIPISTEEQPTEHLFTITARDAVGATATLNGKVHVVMYPFKTQTLRIKSGKLEKEEQEGRSEKAFEEDVARVSEQSPQEKYWTTTFYVPCDMQGISTSFGTLRTTHERGKYRHNALDLLAQPKSAVWASQDGRVVIKDRYSHSGNTVVLDHGCGVLTMYFHLDSFANIECGEMIRKGKPVGKVGMTGYASGYHLHWELRVNNVPVDPMQWTKHDF